MGYQLKDLLLFFCQVILSTNIAESSLTVPDIKYGIVRANFLAL